MAIPSSRARALNDVPARAEGQYVLYWMVAARRPRFNFALERAVAWAKELKRPLLVLEALRIGYPWASARLHRFVLEGMAANAAAFAQTAAHYYPYVEPAHGAGKGLLEALAEKAAVVVTDDYPCFFVPRMQEAAAKRIAVRVEAIDANGVLPMSAARGRAFVTAHSFRRFLQQTLGDELTRRPLEDPLAKARLPKLAKLPSALRFRWPAATTAQLADPERMVARLDVDASVAPVTDVEGGWIAGQWALFRFLSRHFERYAEGRNHPDDEATSRLSPWLHFGHLSTYEALRALEEREAWDGLPRGDKHDGSREGFWGLSANGEAFLEELITWRELAFNTCATLPAYDRYESLPGWALATLEAHAKDRRDPQYSLEELERARTHDPVWNAAQRELSREGRIHNYLRMLWGKKILEWSESPRVALERMIHLNNKYALDGRDPCSYGGISWVLGRYDRPWGPERPIYGTIRYMSSSATARKLRIRRYLERYGDGTLHTLTG